MFSAAWMRIGGSALAGGLAGAALHEVWNQRGAKESTDWNQLHAKGMGITLTFHHANF